MNSNELTPNTIEFIHSKHREEMQYHRNIMLQLFKWSTNILMIIVGVVVTLSSTGKIHIPDLIFGIILLLILAIGRIAFKLINTAKSNMDDNAQVIVKLSKAQGLFDSGQFGREESVYKNKWKNWGKELTSGKYVNYYNDFIFIITVMASVIVLIIWFIL